MKHIVWVIEDEDDFRRQLVSLLNLSGAFQCTHDFRACEPALSLLETDVPPDLILMDIGLPGMNGIEGVRRIKAISPSTEVVILTVFDDNENVVHAIAGGASGYLHKSSTIEETVESLKTILGGGAPVNPHIARKILEMFGGRTSPPRIDYDLTQREMQLLHVLVEDLPQKQIADRLGISHHTVNMHLRNIYAKLRVQSRSGAVAKALKERLL